MIVVDTNVIAYLYLPTEFTEQTEHLLEQEPVWTAPVLWRREFRNVLALYLRKQLIEFEKALEEQAQMLAVLRRARYGSLLTLHVLLLCAAGRTRRRLHKRHRVSHMGRL